MRHLWTIFLFASIAPMLVAAPASPFVGRWKLDKTRSTALDGWHDWELVIRGSGTQVELQYNMRWGRTEVSETNIVDTARELDVSTFFRVEARHMAVYPQKDGKTTVRAAWLDDGRTLRIEALTPVEISQGTTDIRIHSEYRLIEGDDSLVLIELRSSRPQPLVYRFDRVIETQ